MLSGCSLFSKEQTETATKPTQQQNYEKVIKRTGEIRESGKFEKYKNIAYEELPYYQYVAYLIKNREKYPTEKVNFSDFKLVKEAGNFTVISVLEHKLIEQNGANFETEQNYYYIFKKAKEGWKIYDYLPKKVSPNVEELIKKYSK